MKQPLKPFDEAERMRSDLDTIKTQLENFKSEVLRRILIDAKDRLERNFEEHFNSLTEWIPSDFEPRQAGEQGETLQTGSVEGVAEPSSPGPETEGGEEPEAKGHVGNATVADGGAKTGANGGLGAVENLNPQWLNSTDSSRQFHSLTKGWLGSSTIKDTVSELLEAFNTFSETVYVLQEEARFTPEKADSIRVAIGKRLKRTRRGFRRWTLSVLRKGEPQPETRCIPLKNLLVIHFLQHSKPLLTLLGRLETAKAEWQRRVFTTGGFESQTRSSIEEASNQIHSEFTRIESDLDSILKEWFAQVEDDLERVGTFELKSSRYKTATREDSKQNSLLRAESLTARWSGVLETGGESLIASTELNETVRSLYHGAAEIVEDVNRFMLEDVTGILQMAEQTLDALELDVASLSDNLENDEGSGSDGIQKALQKLLSSDRIQSLFAQEIRWFDQEPESKFSRDIDSLQANLLSDLLPLPAHHKLPSRWSIDPLTPKVETRQVEWGDMIRQIVKAQGIDSISSTTLQLKERFSDYRNELIDAQGIVLTNLSAAAESVEDVDIGQNEKEKVDEKSGNVLSPNDIVKIPSVVQKPNTVGKNKAYTSQKGDGGPLAISVSAIQRSKHLVLQILEEIRETAIVYSDRVVDRLPRALDETRDVLLDQNYDHLESTLSRLEMRERALDWRSRIQRIGADALSKSEAIRRWIFKQGSDRLEQIRTLLGIQVREARKAAEKLNVTAYLKETGEKFQSLPFITRRLFNLEYVIDAKFFIDPGKEFKEAKEAFEGWLHGIGNSVAVVGEMGSGKSTAVHFLCLALEKSVRDQESARNASSKERFSGVYSEDYESLKREGVDSSGTDEFSIETVQILWEKTNTQPLFFFRSLSNSLGLKEVETREDLLQQIQTMKGRRIVIFDGLHNLFVRSLYGFEALEAFWSILSETREKFFWILSCNRFAWRFLERTQQAAQMVSISIQTDKFTSESIEKAVILRHRATGYDLEFVPNDEIRSSRAYKRRIGDSTAIQDYLREMFFETLSELSEGNLSVAMIFWIRSLELVDDRRIRIHPIAIPDLDLMDLEHSEMLFALASFAIHDELSPEELSQTLPMDIMRSRNLTLHLHAQGILVRDEDHYSINPLVFRQLIRMLKDKNILH